MRPPTLDHVKRGLLLFWAVWLAVVTLTNLLDALKELSVLPHGWAMASGNYQAVVQATSRYDPPRWLTAVLFAGVIAWEALAAVLFALAWRLYGRGEAGRRARAAAFAAGLALWAAFLLSEEVLIDYKGAAVHWRVFAALLLTLLVVTSARDDR